MIPCFTPRCNELHPGCRRTDEGVLAPAGTGGQMRTEGTILSSLLPRCHSRSYVTSLYVLPASGCNSASLLPLLLLPHGQHPCFSINPPQPTGVLLFLPFILSRTTGVFTSSFPSSWFLTFYTFYQCFSHLWPYSKQPYCTLLQAKTLWAHRAGQNTKYGFLSNKPSENTEKKKYIQASIMNPFQCSVCVCE